MDDRLETILLNHAQDEYHEYQHMTPTLLTFLLLEMSFDVE